MILLIISVNPLLTIAAISAFVISLIFVAKYVLYKTKDYIKKNSLAERTKYSWVDIFKLRGTILNFSIVVSLAICLTLMSWTTYEYPTTYASIDYIVDDIETIPPLTVQQTPPPLPPSPPVIIEPIDEPLEEAPQADLVDMTIDETTVIDEPIIPEPKSAIAIITPPPPPPVKKNDFNKIIGFAEKMPLFGGCSDRACSDTALLKYIAKYLNYPIITRENGIQGRVYIQFIVEKDGKISNSSIIRDIGAGCGEAAQKVVDNMNNLSTSWTPGYQNGNAVRVQYTLPITFKMNEN